jgi:hypothetical protein
MARKERITPPADIEEKLTPEEEEYWRMYDQGYSSLDRMEAWARDRLTSDMEGTKDWIRAYYFGTRFAHSEAYFLCAVGKTWPDFALHPENKGYVLAFSSMNSTTGKTNTHNEFEEYVDENRQEISRKASDSLEINWEEIENF